MCGRFVVSYSYDDLMRMLQDDFDITDDTIFDVPQYNVAPGDNIIALINDTNNYRAGYVKWGLIPKYSNNQNNNLKLINARSETVETKKSFKESFTSKRCIIPCSGFYEWDKLHNNTPYYFSEKEDKLLFMAGLWNKSLSNEGKSQSTTVILTKKANKVMEDIHDRIPVFLNLKQAKDWMNPHIKDITTLKHIIKNSTYINLKRHPVANYVNNVKNKSAKCILEYHELTLF